MAFKWFESFSAFGVAQLIILAKFRAKLKLSINLSPLLFIMNLAKVLVEKK